MNKSTTERGFSLGEFKDLYQKNCSIQKSSLATENAIWFGINNPEPRILASKLSPELTGWVDYPIHPDVHFNTRMHLSQKQVIEILP